MSTARNAALTHMLINHVTAVSAVTIAAAAAVATARNAALQHRMTTSDAAVAVAVAAAAAATSRTLTLHI
jgi:hypothetical protein